MALTLGKNEQEVFRAGDYPQGSYPPERVDRIVSNYARRGHRAPLAPNHDCSQGAALGYVESLRAQWHDIPVTDAQGVTKQQPCYSLIAKVKPSSDYVAGVRDHKWPAYSIGLEYTGEDMNHLAPLGVKSPQVKGMAAPMFAHQDGTFTLHFDEITADGIDLACGPLEATTFDSIPGERPVDDQARRDEGIVYSVLRGFMSLLHRTTSGPVTPVLSAAPAAAGAAFSSPNSEEIVNAEDLKAELSAMITKQGETFAAAFAALPGQFAEAMKPVLTDLSTTFAAAADQRLAAVEAKTRQQAALDRLFTEDKKLTAVQHARLSAIFASLPDLAEKPVQFEASDKRQPLFDAILETFGLRETIVPDLQAQAGREMPTGSPGALTATSGGDAAAPIVYAGLDPADVTRVTSFEALVNDRMKTTGADFIAAVKQIAAERPDLAQPAA